ncbi:NADH:ubiquinone oxidoreductase subunit NDUFA12 [Acuticoccus sp.]|uniref:NADH:ubiquinone oxidoreductase subunit NDUFA12 n=1 Tax=Acuticoccus sp. TaxID=1904378 RepID=UPI003B523128
MAKTGLGRRLLQAFTWWHGATWGTALTTFLRGEEVGIDQFGNRYFRTRKGRIDPALGIERRWVIYADRADASTIPPGWYGWMHHLSKVPPSKDDYTPHEWEAPHQPNMTGTAQAYRPRGSIFRPDPEASITAGYDAWTPGGEGDAR